jgi:hypothetical protein
MSRQSQNVVNIWKDEIVGLFTGERMRLRRLRCEACFRKFRAACLRCHSPRGSEKR